MKRGIIVKVKGGYQADKDAKPVEYSKEEWFLIEGILQVKHNPLDDGECLLVCANGVHAAEETWSSVVQKIRQADYSSAAPSYLEGTVSLGSPRAKPEY